MTIHDRYLRLRLHLGCYVLSLIFWPLEKAIQPNDLDAKARILIPPTEGWEIQELEGKPTPQDRHTDEEYGNVGICLNSEVYFCTGQTCLWCSAPGHTRHRPTIYQLFCG